jgi:hypothetical protein
MKEASRRFARFLRTPAPPLSGSFQILSSTKSQSSKNHEFREIHHHSQWCRVSFHRRPTSVRARELLYYAFHQPGSKWNKHLDTREGSDAIQTHTYPPAWLQHLPNTRRLLAVLYGRDDSPSKPSKRRKCLWAETTEQPGCGGNSTQEPNPECDTSPDRPFTVQNMGKLYAHISS